jgi:hypothetical protein
MVHLLAALLESVKLSACFSLKMTTRVERAPHQIVSIFEQATR